MPKKRPLSDLFNEDVLVVLVSCTDVAARTLRNLHNSPFLYDDEVPSSTSRPRAERDATPQYESEPAAKIVIKFSHIPSTWEGLSFGSDPKCNVVLDGGQKHGISRIHFCLTFDRTSKALLVTDVSSNGTELTTRTFPKQDQESRVLNSSRYPLSQSSIVLSEDDEIRAGVVVLKVVVVRRPEPSTQAWVKYVDKVDRFIEQCDKNQPSRSAPKSDITTVLDPTTLGSLCTAGKGSCARVLKMIDSRGNLYGVKVPLDESFNDMIQKELDCLQKIHHKHIVSVVNGKNPSLVGPSIVMNYIPMNLQQFSSSSMPTVALRQVMEQLLGALCYAHGRSILHRDVKPSNVLIQNLNPLEIKLADFGVSSTDKAQRETFVGTLRYKAPEIIPNKKYDARVDVWSAGVVLAEYSLPSQYFQNLEETANFNTTTVVNSIQNLESNKKSFTSLLESMLVEGPGGRASSKEAFESVRLLAEFEDNRTLEEATASNEEIGDLLPTEVMATIRHAPGKLATQDSPSQS